jgi:hypothetical protein
MNKGKFFEKKKNKRRGSYRTNPRKRVSSITRGGPPDGGPAAFGEISARAEICFNAGQRSSLRRIVALVMRSAPTLL